MNGMADEICSNCNKRMLRKVCPDCDGLPSDGKGKKCKRCNGTRFLCVRCNAPAQDHYF